MKHGIQKQIAAKAGITEQYLSFILNNKRDNVSKEVAKKLSEASREFGLDISPEDWVFRGAEIKQALKESHVKGE